jgi:hypothetical protein
VVKGKADDDGEARANQLHRSCRGSGDSEQETEPSQTGLRRRCESSATHSHRETTAPAPVLDSTRNRGR